MRTLPPLLVAAALLLGGCATTAQGAGVADQTSPSSTGSAAAAGEGPLPHASSPVAPSGSPTPASSSSGPSAAASATTPSPGPSGLLAASPVSSGPPLPPNPFELGGPAPVGSFVLGDSIALGVAPQLTRLGYPVVGIVGRSASEAYLRENLATPLAQQAPAWVIVLGTNHSGDPADVARLEGLVDVIDSQRTPGDRQRVYWVTPHRDPRYSGGMSAWSLESFGAELDRLAAERRWLEVIDFASTARLHPEWYDADAGRLHPDARGQGVLAALIAGPDAVPVEIPAPLFSGPPSPSPEPETFVNAPQRPSKKATESAVPTATPTPGTTAAPTPAETAPAADAATPMSTPVPIGPAATPSPEAPSPEASVTVEASTASPTPG
jgi:hypothetical protein